MSEPKGAVWTEMLYDVGEGGDWSEMSQGPHAPSNLGKGGINNNRDEEPSPWGRSCAVVGDGRTHADDAAPRVFCWVS